MRGLKALQGLGVRGTPTWLAAYLTDSLAFAANEVERLAQTVGGGHCGAAPASMVQSAALQLAASRAAFEAGDTLKGSRLANDSRQNLLAAHELCAKEAEQRRSSQPRGNRLAAAVARIRQAEQASPQDFGGARDAASNPSAAGSAGPTHTPDGDS